MGIFTSLFEKRDSGSLAGPPDFLINAFGGGITKAGIHVNEDRALSLTPVWAAINLIADTMGIFPLHIYRKTGLTTKTWTPQHKLYPVIHDAPNEYITAFDWCNMMASNQLVYGAGISEIEFDGDGFPVALWPIPTPRVTPASTSDGKLRYLVTTEKGQQKTLRPEQLLIFRFWPTIDGGWLSPIAKHRETLGSALAVREFGARMFGQGVNPAGVVSGVKRAINEDAAKTRRERFAAYSGLGESHRIMLLEEGEKFDRISLPPEDAQYLETRKFDTSEIARIYRVPLFLLQEHEKSTSWGSGIAEMKEAFVVFTMLRYCVQWEQEINKKLLDDGHKYYCKFTVEGLLRGSLKDRMEAYTKGANMGIYSIDEMREMEDLNPLPDNIGAARLVPLNMQTIEKAISGENAKNQNAGGTI